VNSPQRPRLGPQEAPAFSDTSEVVMIEELLQQSRDLHTAHGTDVRCPVCDAGIGKFCRDADGNRILHAERVALSHE
jgi:hypothetical protein